MAKIAESVAIFITLMLLGCSPSNATEHSFEPGSFDSRRSESFSYESRGVGGGGAMAGYSISPYSALRFVGTDMGTLFRSEDGGAHWTPVRHSEALFSSDLDHAVSVGFSADPQVVFHASGGLNPKRSRDGGVTWHSVPMDLNPNEFIKYWLSDRLNPLRMWAATTQGLFSTRNQGETWHRASDIQGESKGSFVHHEGDHFVLYHSTASAIYVSDDGEAFRPWFTPERTQIRSFAGGADLNGLTLSFIDTQGEQACAWALESLDVSEEDKVLTLAECGFVWVKRDGSPLQPNFIKSTQEAGRFVRMAENDSQTLYATGGNWVRQYGSKIWVSRDAGRSWSLKLQTYDWDQVPYAPWPRERLEYSAVGLDVGWDDNAYSSFTVNSLNSADAGGTGYYFLHVTHDHGETWKAPFTEYADQGPRESGKKWRSTGLEVVSVLKLKFHPSNPRLGYASTADIGGMITEDGGETWRVSKVEYNTNYDYAFDPSRSDWVYAASGNVHDYPMSDSWDPSQYKGGIYRSTDRGRVWTRLTPATREWDRQFLAVAYDSVHGILYGGSQGAGVAWSRDGGSHWEFINRGLPSSSLIIPQIEIDPVNGNAYALLAGERPDFANQAVTGIYLLDPTVESPSWKLLRGIVNTPDRVSSDVRHWYFPTAFAVDWSRPDRDVLWLADYESLGNWLSSGVWKSTDGGQEWNRVQQYTHPTQLTIDPQHPDTVYASGLFETGGTWGEGGPMHTTDGGQTWNKNPNIVLQDNLYGTALDPNDPERLFYLFFGGGMLYGPRP